MKRLKRGLVVTVTIFLTLLLLSSCNSDDETNAVKSKRERSKNYQYYTDMVAQFPLGSEYDDITAYLDEQDLMYTTKTENLPKIQVYGGQLFFSADNTMNSLYSTSWQHPDGWGVGSTLDEVEAVYSQGAKVANTADITYNYKSDGVLITVVFDEHYIVTRWSLS